MKTFVFSILLSSAISLVTLYLITALLTPTGKDPHRDTPIDGACKAALEAERDPEVIPLEAGEQDVRMKQQMYEVYSR